MTAATPPVPDNRPGLPPVEPPSGRLLGQLFLVPGLIVAGVVLILLFFNWLVSGPRSPDAFLRRLDEPNPEVRWRAAADLSQVLLRDDQLASNSAFALALALRLDRARADAAGQEEALAGRLSGLSPEELMKEQAKREQERNYVNFLAACLGNFVVPAGATVLQQLAVTETGVEPRALAWRRRDALWALANLGQNLKRFDHLPAAQQEAALAGLGEPMLNREQEAWAAAAKHHLQCRLQGTADTMGMDRTLAACARAKEPFLRELAAFAANFWTGDAIAEARIEETLAALSHDDGRGEELLQEWARDDPGESQEVAKVPGLVVRINATIALARRGSSRARPEALQEMLDESRLQKAFVLRSKTGQEQPNTAFVDDTLVNTLKAVSELQRRRPELAMPGVAAAVTILAGHDNANLANQAKETLLTLQK